MQTTSIIKECLQKALGPYMSEKIRCPAFDFNDGALRKVMGENAAAYLGLRVSDGADTNPTRLQKKYAECGARRAG